MSYFYSLLFVFVSSFTVANAAPLNVPNFHQINAQIYRGGRPTAEGMKSLKAAGIKSVINLENVASAVNNEREMAKQNGLGFMSSPMSWISAPSDQQIDKILTVMSNPKNQPVYIHCLHGRDRTGLVSALYRVLVEGMAPKTAYSEMKALGFRSLFVSLEYYFRQRTGFWDLRFKNVNPNEILPPQEDTNELDGELHDDNDVFVIDPTDLQN